MSHSAKQSEDKQDVNNSTGNAAPSGKDNAAHLCMPWYTATPALLSSLCASCVGRETRPSRACAAYSRGSLSASGVERPQAYTSCNLHAT